MKAERMFRELGFSIIGNYEKLIIYQRKTDFEEVTIWFRKKDFLPRTYDIRYMDWIEHKSDDWIPMEERKECNVVKWRAFISMQMKLEKKG